MKETKFKQTEVGMVPRDWDVKPIKELGVFLGGGTPSTKKESFWKGNIPWISSADLSDDDIEHISMTRFISQDAVNCSATQICPQGTILIIARVGVGKLALSQQKVCTSQDFCNLIPSKENSSKFLAYALLPMMKQMANETQGTSIKGIAVDEIKKIQISFPSSKAEQNAIANALSDVDLLINNLEKLIAKKKNIKQGAMQQLLTGKKRLSGFDGVWGHDKLGNIAKMNSGGTPSSENSHYYGGKIPFLSIGDMTKSGKYIFRTEKSITQLGLDNSSARVFPAGTLLYAMYASLGKCSISKIDLAISQAILGFRLSNLIDRDFLYYYFCFIENTIKNIGQTGTQSNLSKSIVENFEIYHPHDVSEQKAIAKILSDMDAEIATIETKLSKYRKLKTGMMQQLLTGKIRLV